MTRVTLDNVSETYERIRKSIAAATFVALDTEFTALYLTESQKQSLFDNVEERYAKLRKTASQIIPVQLGLTTFHHEIEKGSYKSETFTFYLWPRPFKNFNKTLSFSNSSFQFLCDNNFDFNELIYKGVPFLNRAEEELLKRELKEEAYGYDIGLEKFFEELIETVSKWFNSANKENLMLENVWKKYGQNFEAKYYIHVYLRSTFNNLWTYETPEGFFLSKTPKAWDLDDETLQAALGFTKIFRLLTQIRKPLIGHNVFMDLLLIYNSFEQPLPKSYSKFKQEITNLFPKIYDTRTICRELTKTLSKSTIQIPSGDLQVLYEFFKDSHGRHIALNSPFFHSDENPSSDHFHDAGWDSYCTGYIFLRMAHIWATAPYKANTRYLTSTEHFAAVEHLANKINLIRCSISHVILDGNDPTSTRPSYLLAEHKSRKALDITQLTTLLSTCGHVEVRPMWGKQRALIAVDNYNSARRILSKFREESDYYIRPYAGSKWKAARLALWGGVLTSGGLLLAWLVRETTRK